ncbi:hypothetical protein [Streptomyces sp. NBC_01235]|uniref:hypothetical protein n=1 Tax=Streptomyces sp. NBC_01235 TaxID=2903788 RepID=UPI002E119237
MKPGLYICVDVESDGPIPSPYSLLSLGAAVAGRQDADGFTAADPKQAELFAKLMAWPGPGPV